MDCLVVAEVAAAVPAALAMLFPDSLRAGLFGRGLVPADESHGLYLPDSPGAALAGRGAVALDRHRRLSNE